MKTSLMASIRECSDPLNLLNGEGIVPTNGLPKYCLMRINNSWRSYP